jgi:D-beta-D-heptose 7-phosphate kinase/D-beta-D-heptose 1-phosphate adenosyltransferase
MNMDRIEIEAFLGKLSKCKVLVIGDLMLDEYLWGGAERISPEAPVPVVAVRAEERRLGGAGNVALNLAMLGCPVAIAGVTGADEDGVAMRQLFTSRGIDAAAVLACPGRFTTRKTRVIAQHQQLVRIDRERCDTLEAAQEQSLLHAIRAALPECRAMVVSDYLKGTLTDGLLTALIALGRELAIPVVVDPKGTDYSRYRGATVLTPNRRELQAATGNDGCDDQALLQAGRTLRRQLDLEALVLTRSEQGMTLFFRTGEPLHLATEAREVFDVTGAGDTVLAVIGAGLAAGLSLQDAARLSNVAAGIVVGKVGTSTVAPGEILEVVGRQHRDTELKIHDRQRLAVLLDERRARGERVVFTNGCFDLLHVGHVKYLQAARKLGDLLVLGLNTDASIRRLKGPKRPLIGQDERAHILAALDCIDYVVIFDEDTPLELIAALKPEILVKGADYSPEEVVGRELVESWGGRVELIQFVDGKSTSTLINKILETYQDA